MPGQVRETGAKPIPDGMLVELEGMDLHLGQMSPWLQGSWLLVAPLPSIPLAPLGSAFPPATPLSSVALAPLRSSGFPLPLPPRPHDPSAPPWPPGSVSPRVSIVAGSVTGDHIPGSIAQVLHHVLPPVTPPWNITSAVA